MNKNLIILVVLSFLYSCEQYAEPGSQTLEVFNYQLTGNNQYGKAGEYLDMEIGSTVYFESQINNSNEKFHTEFLVESGGGTLDNTTVEADSNFNMTTRWKLGNTGNLQIVKGKISDESGKLYSVFTIQANAYTLSGWNLFQSGLLTNITDMVVDTVNHRSLMLTTNGLFELKGLFYQWEQIQWNNYPGLRTLEINSKGEIFGGRWDGRLYKSNDWGKSWVDLNKPIDSNTSQFELTITPDDYIWVNKWEKGVYCSTDGGLSWSHDTTGLVIKEQLSRVYQFNDSHVALSLNQLNILQSFDKGITWKKIETPLASVDLFVTSNNELIACNQEGGLSLHKTTNPASGYKKVLTAQVSYGTTPMRHIFAKFGRFHYFLAPGGGIYKTHDFESFEKILAFNLQRHLFIDHTGTLYAGGFSGESVYVLPAAAQ